MDAKTGTSGAAPNPALNQRAPDEASSLLNALEVEQLTGAKNRQFGRRRLGRGTRALMWALRLYVLLMLVVVADRVAQAINGG